MTRGLPEELLQPLELLSSYDMDAEGATGADPIEFAYRIITVRGRPYRVVSRIGPCGPDASGRPNRVAHHIVVDPAMASLAGPAWIMQHYAGFAKEPPRVEERVDGPYLPNGAVEPRKAEAWRLMRFDPAWAGLIAQAVLDDPHSRCYLVFEHRLALLPLLEDVLALLPPERRWMATFSTRFAPSVIDELCQIRCVLAGPARARGLLRDPSARVFSITQGAYAPAGPGASAGKSGQMVETSRVTAMPGLHGSTPSAPRRESDDLDAFTDQPHLPPPMPIRTSAARPALAASDLRDPLAKSGPVPIRRDDQPHGQRRPSTRAEASPDVHDRQPRRGGSASGPFILGPAGYLFLAAGLIMIITIIIAILRFA